LILGRCTATLSGIHKPDRKLDTWCTACGHGRPLPSTKAHPVEGTFHVADETAEPVPEVEDCTADPTGNGLHWRDYRDPKNWCRACGQGGAPIAEQREHLSLLFVLTPADQQEAKRAQRALDRRVNDERLQNERIAQQRARQTERRLDQALGVSEKNKATLERRRELLRQRREEDEDGGRTDKRQQPSSREDLFA